MSYIKGKESDMSKSIFWQSGQIVSADTHHRDEPKRKSKLRSNTPCQCHNANSVELEESFSLLNYKKITQECPHILFLHVI